MLTGACSSMSGVSRATSASGLSQRANSNGPSQRAPPTVTPANRMSTSGIKCFGYGETGHR